MNTLFIHIISEIYRKWYESDTKRKLVYPFVMLPNYFTVLVLGFSPESIQICFDYILKYT